MWTYWFFRLRYDAEEWLMRLGAKRRSEVFYIGGNDVFPPPLTSEQEAEMVAKLHGDGGPKAKAVLIERNLRLVVYIARKFENTGINVEDLISIGTIHAHLLDVPGSL